MNIYRSMQLQLAEKSANEGFPPNYAYVRTQHNEFRALTTHDALLLWADYKCDSLDRVVDVGYEIT